MRLFVLNGSFWDSSIVSILILFNVLLLCSVSFILNLRIILLIMVINKVFFFIIVGVWWKKFVFVVSDMILIIDNNVKFVLICLYFN